MQTTLAIGITGGIGGGKSEACRIFERHGATVIDADALARELMDSHPAIQRRIRKQLGDHLYGPDGHVDRKAMSKMLFTDDSARKKINEIVHPVVIEEIAGLLSAARQKRSPWGVIVEAALIYESGVESLFDYVIVVTADQELRTTRVMQRSGLSRQEVLERMESQMSDEEKCSRADFVIHNDGTTADLAARCLLIEKLMKGLGAPATGEDS
jgi:dephospho-CoA kinase